jgi:DNA topoisomerase-3
MWNCTVIVLAHLPEHDGTGWKITDGSAGLLGDVIKSDKWAELKEYAATFIQGAASGFVDQQMYADNGAVYQSSEGNFKNAAAIATDADREGEMIARELLEDCNYSKRISRLWLSALDPESIRKALEKLKDGAETAPLYHAALARSRGDWLVGMNMTRFITLRCRNPKEKGVLSVGRVQTPTLALVVRRDREIESFKPRDYFEVISNVGTNGGTVLLRYAPKEDERIYDRAQAEEIAKNATGVAAPLKAEKERKTKSPPKLFSFAGFQMKTNAAYGWSADKALTIAQALYETYKVTTYPRTDCEFLPEEQIGDVPEILANLKTVDTFKELAIGEPVIRKTVFNTAKITAHHSIIPTKIKPDLTAMSSDERDGYGRTVNPPRPGQSKSQGC